MLFGDPEKGTSVDSVAKSLGVSKTNNVQKKKVKEESEEEESEEENNKVSKKASKKKEEKQINSLQRYSNSYFKKHNKIKIKKQRNF